jgi:sugar phosphate isomerase/epimerase
MNLKDQIYTTSQQHVLARVHVNMPFVMLVEKPWQDMVLGFGLNPEIGLDAAALDGHAQTDFAGMAEKLQARHLEVTIHGPFLDLSPGSPDAAIRETTWKRFHQMVDAMAVFRPKTVVCHAAYDAARYDFCREEWLENSIKTWQWVADAVAGCGARLMLENVYERTPGELLMVLEHFAPEMVGCCLDVGHQSVFSDTPLSVWIERLAPYIRQLHLHDNCGDYDAHLGMGRGSIDYTPVFEFFKSRTHAPVITLEPHHREDFRSSIAYLEKHRFFTG